MFLREKFSRRYARGLSKAIITGTDANGNALPNVQSIVGVAQSVSAVGTNLAAGLGWDDLTNLIQAVDPAYAGENASFVMNSFTRNYLLGLKDGFGRLYFTPDPANDRPFDKLIGYELVIDQNLPNANTANATPILFGSLSESYLFRQVNEGASILRLNERYADTLGASQSAFVYVVGNVFSYFGRSSFDSFTSCPANLRNDRTRLYLFETVLSLFDAVLFQAAREWTCPLR